MKKSIMNMLKTAAVVGLLLGLLIPTANAGGVPGIMPYGDIVEEYNEYS